MLKTIRVEFEFDDDVLKALIKRCGGLQGLKQTIYEGAMGELEGMYSMKGQSKEDDDIRDSF